MEPLRFVLNGRPVHVDGVPPTTTLLRWLRDHAHLPGTKEGCAEGDCGACTVAVLDGAGPTGPAWRAVNACLLFLPMVHGRQVVTVEGLREGATPHPAQVALVDALGSQCGYCTPGVVMTTFEACYRTDLDAPHKLDDQLCGNLCRCTGYRPILDAAKAVAGSAPDDRFAAALAAPVERPAAATYRDGDAVAVIPRTLAELHAALAEHPDARVVAGGTDLGLLVTKRHAPPRVVILLEHVDALHGVVDGPDGWSIGAATPLSNLEHAVAGRLPMLASMLRYFGSRQIKHRATVGGNLCNASPIGDLAPALIAYGAVAVIAGPIGERRVALEDFFESYRKTSLRLGEVLARVELPPVAPGTIEAAYKVSKRRELDISAVSGAFAVVVDGGTVQSARLAYGGMAATPARAPGAEAALVGQPWSAASVEAAAAALAGDFSPLSDHRGSAWYRATVAGNLLRGFFADARAPLPDRPTSMLHTGVGR